MRPGKQERTGYEVGVKIRHREMIYLVIITGLIMTEKSSVGYSRSVSS